MFFHTSNDGIRVNVNSHKFNLSWATHRDPSAFNFRYIFTNTHTLTHSHIHNWSRKSTGTSATTALNGNLSFGNNVKVFVLLFWSLFCKCCIYEEICGISRILYKMQTFFCLICLVLAFASFHSFHQHCWKCVSANIHSTYGN